MKPYLLCAVCWSGLCQASVVTIPQESGFSGSVMVGVGGMDYQSNLFKGPAEDNARHHGVHSSPESQGAITPVLVADVRYTFAQTRTQLFLGDPVQDAVRFDFTQQAGIRQQLSDKGIVSAGYVFSFMPLTSWQDPYAPGERDETHIKSGGGRLTWEHVWGSSFNAAYTVRRFDIGDEKSGESLTLSPSERALLNRNGNTHDIALSYDWLVAPGHLLHPEITYSKADLDGRAMSYDKTMLQLSYGYNTARWAMVSNVFGSQLTYDEANPIYAKKADATEAGVNSTFFWHRLAGIRGMDGFISASYSRSDADVSFYDAYVKSLSAGVLYRF